MCATRIPDPTLTRGPDPTLPSVDLAVVPPSEQHVSNPPLPPSVFSFSSENKRLGKPLTSVRNILDLSSTKNIFNATHALYTQAPSTWEEILEKQQEVAYLLDSIKKNTDILNHHPQGSEKQTHAIIFLMLGTLCIENQNPTKEEIKETRKLLERAAELGDDKLGTANYILGKYLLKRCAYLINKIPSSHDEIQKCFTRAKEHLDVAYSLSKNNIGARIYGEFAKEYLHSNNIEKAYKNIPSCIKDCTKNLDTDYYLVKLKMYGFNVGTDHEIEKDFEELTNKLAKDNHKKSKCHAYIGKILMKKFLRDVREGLTEILKHILLKAYDNLELGKKTNVPRVWEYLYVIKNKLYNEKTQDNAFCYKLYDDIKRDYVVVDSEHIKSILRETNTDINARLEDDEIDKLIHLKHNDYLFCYAPTLLLEAIESFDYNTFEALIENGADPLDVIVCRKTFLQDEYNPNVKYKMPQIKDDIILHYLQYMINNKAEERNAVEYDILKSGKKNKGMENYYKKLQTNCNALIKMRNLVANHIKKTKEAIIKNSETGQEFGCHLHWHINNFRDMESFLGDEFDFILKHENNVNAGNSEGITPLMLLCHKSFTHSHEAPRNQRAKKWETYIEKHNPYCAMLKKLIKNCGLDFTRRDNFGRTVLTRIADYPTDGNKLPEEMKKHYKDMQSYLTKVLKNAGATPMPSTTAPPTKNNKNNKKIQIDDNVKIRKTPRSESKSLLRAHERTQLGYLKGDILLDYSREHEIEFAYNNLSNILKKKSFERNGEYYQNPFPTHENSFEGISVMKGYTLVDIDLTGFNLSGTKNLCGDVFNGACYLKDIHGKTVITLSSKGYDNFEPSTDNLRHVLANPNLENYEQLAFYALLHPNMLETTQEDGFNALREAAHSGDGYFVNIVLGTQPNILDPGALGENGYTPLMSFISKAKKADDTCNAGIRGLFHYMQYAAYSGELYYTGVHRRGLVRKRPNCIFNKNRWWRNCA